LAAADLAATQMPRAPNTSFDVANGRPIHEPFGHDVR
jgi:hypothetical protein